MMNYLRKHLYLLVVILLNGFNAFSQGSPEFKKYKAFFPTEASVVTQESKEINIEIVGKSLNITTETFQERLLLDNRAGLFSDFSLSYDDFSLINNIHASTLLPQKSGFKEIKVKEFKTTERLSKSVFFDGSKNVAFFYPSLTEGAKTRLKYSQTLSQPQFMPVFRCQSSAPIIEATYTISAPEEVEIGWKMFNIPDSLITFTKKKNKNKVIYTWKVNNVKQYKPEPHAPNFRYTTAHMITWIRSYKAEGVEIPVLRSPQDLYNWYAEISETSNDEHSEELKNLTDSLTLGCTDELEKVKKIYYWVQDHIRYIAIEDGMGGFVPRSGKLVYERRYGDCKDMASIITKMLSYAGIPSYLTWIGSRDIPYKYEDIPTPHTDNHMIAAYINNNNYYFLDATGTYTPFDMPTSFIQGKQAMIGKGRELFEIREVPVMPSEKNNVWDTVMVDIVGNKLVGNGKINYSGYNRISMVEVLSHHNADKDKFLKDKLHKGSNKFLIDEYRIEGLEDRDQLLNINYDFNIQDYINNYSDEIFVNLNLNKDFFMEEITNERRLDIHNEHKETMINYIALNIPDGYKAGKLPQRQVFDDEKFGFDISYEMTDNKIVLQQKVYYNFLTLSKNDFDLYNKMVKSLKKAYSEVLVLEKKVQ